jgi:hypothetical protein
VEVEVMPSQKCPPVPVPPVVVADGGWLGT